MHIVSIVLFFCIFIWEGFITHNSRQIGHQSEARSQTSLEKWLRWQKKWPQFWQHSWAVFQRKLTTLFYPLYPELTQRSPLEFEHFLIRKAAHMTQFFVLTSFGLGFWHSLAFPWYNIMIYSLAMTLLASVVDEFIQHFVPNRSASVIDVLVDFSGGILATILYCMLCFLIFF